MTNSASASNPISIGRLLRSGIKGCVVGSRLSQQNAPTFGKMVRIPLEDQTTIYGLIYDIHIDDDGLVRQLVSTEGISDEVIEDNRRNRNVPLEMSVVFVGYERQGQFSHLLPPRPPLTLDSIQPCSAVDLAHFTSYGQFGYLRHLLGDPNLPAAELLAVHVRDTLAAHAGSDPHWYDQAVNAIIAMLKDDYPQLLAVLGALSEIA
jgi:hypothetical protein